MAVLERWKIYWNDYSSDTYLNGSEIVYHSKNNVEFRNNLMPSGTIIKQWYSKVDFQRQKIEPALPIIDGESYYHISIDISGEEADRCIIRLLFFDRYEQEAGDLLLTEPEMDFRCPLKTYSYRLQLISGGTTQFVFHSIEIQEIEAEEAENEET